MRSNRFRILSKHSVVTRAHPGARRASLLVPWLRGTQDSRRLDTLALIFRVNTIANRSARLLPLALPKDLMNCIDNRVWLVELNIF